MRLHICFSKNACSSLIPEMPTLRGGPTRSLVSLQMVRHPIQSLPVCIGNDGMMIEMSLNLIIISHVT